MAQTELKPQKEDVRIAAPEQHVIQTCTNTPLPQHGRRCDSLHWVLLQCVSVSHNVGRGPWRALLRRYPAAPASNTDEDLKHWASAHPNSLLTSQNSHTDGGHTDGGLNTCPAAVAYTLSRYCSMCSVSDGGMRPLHRPA